MRKFIVVGLVVATLLSGCSQPVALEPAGDAVNKLCAEVSVRLPDSVPGRSGDLDRRETNAQGTGAWGDPSVVLLRCGVAVPDPTSNLRCYSAGSVDWLLDESKDPTLVYTTYGRTPATQVVVNKDKAAGGVVLLALQDAVSSTTKVTECTTIDDSVG